MVALDWLLISLASGSIWSLRPVGTSGKVGGWRGDGEGWFASFCVCLKDCEEQNLMEFKVASQSSEI